MGGQRVQPHERLIHQDEFGRVEQCRQNGQLLLHAVGVRADGLAQRFGQRKTLAVHPYPLGAGSLADAEHIRNEIQILDTGHVAIKGRVIRQIGQLTLGRKRVVPHGTAVHPHLAAIRLQDAAAAFQGGGLARPVRPDEAEDLSRPDGQCEVFHRRFLAVLFGQMPDLQHSDLSFRS